MGDGKVKNIFLMFSVVLALLLMPILSQATEMIIDGSGDIAVTSGEVAVVAGEVSDAATADTSLADDATISEDDSTIVVPVIEDPGGEETISEPADPIVIEDPIEEPIEDPTEEPVIVDPIDPIEEPIDNPVEEPVNTTPLPSTLVLLGSGLLALSGLGWRRHNKR
ncbi:MAG: PEP-CTERM sorting domain-containing protein [Syntrophobacterales bacterium]